MADASDSSRLSTSINQVSRNVAENYSTRLAKKLQGSETNQPVATANVEQLITLLKPGISKYAIPHSLKLFLRVQRQVLATLPPLQKPRRPAVDSQWVSSGVS
jgi:hypothetical protein